MSSYQQSPKQSKNQIKQYKIQLLTQLLYNFMQMQLSVIFIFVVLGSLISQFSAIQFSKDLSKRKSSSIKSSNDKNQNKKQISDFAHHAPRVITYKKDFQFETVQNTRKELTYINLTYEQISLLGKGLGGRVVLVRSGFDRTNMVVKQFYQDDYEKFERENLIMQKLGYSIWWSKSFGNKPQKKENMVQMDVSHNKYNQKPFTIAIYPYEQSSFDAQHLEFNEKIVPLYFYQVAMQLLICHKKSIVHQDLKPANILIKKLDYENPYLQAQIIDWAQASFYIQGHKSQIWPGNVYYQSIEKLLHFQYTGPAHNVWTLGLIMFQHYLGFKLLNSTIMQGQSLFTKKIDHLCSLIGSEAVIVLQQKYRSNSPKMIGYLRKLEKTKEVIQKKNLKKFLNSKNKGRFTEELLQIFEHMLHPDPQLRMTISELLKTDFMRKAEETLSVNLKKRQSK